jgi:serine protease Do
MAKPFISGLIVLASMPALATADGIIGARVSTISEGVNAGRTLLVAVTPGGPADKAGLKQGDIVLRIGNKEPQDAREFVSMVLAFRPGQKVEFHIRRESKDQKISVTIAEPAGLIGASLSAAPDGADAGRIVVAAITSGGPAEKAGLKKNDIILKVGDKEMKTLRDFTRAILAIETGEVAELLIVREHKERKVKVSVNGWSGPQR